MDMAVDKNMPVLIVDDYKTMLRIVRNLLRQVGFENVDEATDGTDALRKIRANETPYGLIISDWNTAPMSGIEFLRQVRADEKLSKIPFIMIVADPSTERIDTAEEAGVDSWVTKPFNAAHLKEKMMVVLGEF